MLIDCLVYIAILFVVMTLAFALFYRGFEESVQLERNSQSLACLLHAGEKWRADVRSASGSIVASTNKEDGTLMLEIPSGGKVIAYGVLDGTVYRRGDALEDWQQIMSGLIFSQMTPDTRRHVTAWRWEVELYRKYKRNAIKPGVLFEAVPGYAAQAANRKEGQ